ncbi:MAG: DUF4203 domain-containing protein [Oliverpabstia sp.]
MNTILNYVASSEQMQLLMPLLLLMEVIFAVLNCFFGYKLMKFWVALCGFMMGSVGGYLLITCVSTDRTVVFGSSLTVGLVLGFLAYEIYLVGLLFLGWCMTFAVSVMIGRGMQTGIKEKLAVLGIGALLGILVGVLCVLFARTCIILLTGISGGLALVSSAVTIAGKSLPIHITLPAGAMMAVIGVGIQWYCSGKDTKRT